MRVAKAGLISLVGGAVGAVSGLLLAVVVGRLLGPHETGLFFQLIALFMILANVLELGADTGMVRQLSRQLSTHRHADLRRTSVIAVVPVLIVCAVVVAAILLFAPGVAGLIASGDDTATMTDLVSASAMFLLPAALLTVLLGGTRGLGSVTPFVAVFNVALPASRVVIVGVALAAGAGLLGAVYAWTWPLVVACAIAAAVLLRQLSKAPKSTSDSRTPTRALAKEFWSFSAARGVAAAVEVGLQWLDVLLVAALLGPTQGGIYAVASRAARAGLLIDTAARMAVSPRISGALAVGDSAGVARLHLAATRAMILLAWPIYATLALFAPLVLTVFGEGFDTGADTVRVLSVAMMLLIGAGMVQSVLLMGGHSRWQVYNKAAALTTNVVGIVVLVPLVGIVGAAIAWIATVVVDAGLATYQVHRSMGIHFAARELLLPLVIVAGTVLVPGVAAVLVLGQTWLSLIVHLIVAGAAFGAVCWKLRRRFLLA